MAAGAGFEPTSWRFKVSQATNYPSPQGGKNETTLDTRRRYPAMDNTGIRNKHIVGLVHVQCILSDCFYGYRQPLADTKKEEEGGAND